MRQPVTVDSGKYREPIAVTGLSCWYPGAKTPVELWENVLSCRVEFRRIPRRTIPTGRLLRVR